MKAIFAAAAMISLGSVQAHARSSTFDPPLYTKKQVFHWANTTELTCRYYPHFMVKQIADGDEGARQLSIVPIPTGVRQPCRVDNLPTERVVKPNDWNGYFKGVRGDYVFFDAADGVNGGLGFAVFTADTRKLFEDSAPGDLESTTLEGGALTLRYTRSFTGECSEPHDGAVCWKQLAAAAGIDEAAKPDCVASYAEYNRRIAESYCGQDRNRREACFANRLREFDARHADETPSVVTYRVEVVIRADKPTMKALSGALSCRPAD